MAEQRLIHRIIHRSNHRTFHHQHHQLHRVLARLKIPILSASVTTWRLLSTNAHVKATPKKLRIATNHSRGLSLNWTCKQTW
jgi:hypothetical protein